MIESGYISEVNEREKSPFADVIAGYVRATKKQTARADRRNRPLLAKELKVVAYANRAIEQITLLEA